MKKITINGRSAKSSPLMVKSFNKTFGVRSLSHSKPQRSGTSTLLPSLKATGKAVATAMPMKRNKNGKFRPEMNKT